LFIKLNTFLSLKPALLSSILLVSACAVTPEETQTDIAPPVDETPEPPPAEVVYKAIPETTLYSLIAAEFALQRKQFNVGLQNYRNEALQTRDIEVIKRATQIARVLRKRAETLELAELWYEAQPDDREVKLILLSEYIYKAAYDQALELSKTLMTATEAPGIEDIAIETARSESKERAQLSGKFALLIEDHPENIDLLVGQSILLMSLSQNEQALEMATRAELLAPQNTRVLYQLYRVQYALGLKEETRSTYKRMVDLQPDNFRLRSQYAKLLINQDLPAALQEYEHLHKLEPDNPEVLVSLALLRLDAGKLDAAKVDFERLIALNKHTDLSRLSLGDIAVSNRDLSAALNHFMSVKPSKHYVDAVSKAANIILKTDGLEQALIFTAGRRENSSGENKESLYLLETDMLVRTGSHLAAENLFELALADFPDSLSVLYSRAMYFSDKKNTSAAESDFQQILKAQPENATVLNALGYTLLVQTPRIEDAGAYIEKAYSLNQDDAAIVDSMGWLHFMRGDADKAIPILERALSLFNDGEIAAHLGEALWENGKRKRAKKVWSDSLKKDAKNRHILEVIKRLGVKL